MIALLKGCLSYLQASSNNLAEATNSCRDIPPS